MKLLAFCRQMKVEHLKKRAAEDLKHGKYRSAYQRSDRSPGCRCAFCAISPPLKTKASLHHTNHVHGRYTEAIEICPDKDALRRLHSNRSLAFGKAGRYAEALQDADRAISLSPCWDKAHLRKGAALQGLKRHADAAQSFRDAWHLSKGK